MTPTETYGLLHGLFDGLYLKTIRSFWLKKRQASKLESSAHLLPDISIELPNSESAAMSESSKSMDLSEASSVKEKLEEISPRSAKRRMSSQPVEVVPLQRKRHAGNLGHDSGLRLVTAPMSSRISEELVTFRSGDGQLSSAMTLTSRMVQSANFVFQCRSEIQTAQQEIDSIIETAEEMWVRVCELRQMSNRTVEEQMELDIGNNDVTKYVSQRSALEAQIASLRLDIGLPQTQILNSIREVLKEGGLLDEVPVPEDGGYEGGRRASYHTSPTPSELHLDLAKETIRTATLKLQAAQEKLDNWQSFYRGHLEDFKHGVFKDEQYTCQSDFDRHMLVQAQEATGDLIDAEQQYDDAKLQARALGLVTHEYAQSSGFADYQDDGYRESQEAELIENVDTGKILRWMEEQKSDDAGDPVEVDAWDGKSVDLCDSVSLVAEGKDRTKIDSWRSTCMQVADESKLHVIDLIGNQVNES